VVVAEIKGSEKPDEVLVFSAHLDHPKESANDNASGSGALLDIARSISRLIKDHKLPQPKRTLRFMWVPEWYGTMAYIDAHPELKGPPMGGTVLANMNMDMVGENLEKLHSQLIITRNPLSIPNVLRDLAKNIHTLSPQERSYANEIAGKIQRKEALAPKEIERILEIYYNKGF